MLKQTIKFRDFDGAERTEDHYFNLTKAELIELEVTEDGGFTKRLESIVASGNNREILGIWKQIIKLSYGIRSEDGRYFRKYDGRAAEDFLESAAWEEFFLSIAMDGNAAAKFVNGLMPADLVAAAQKELEAKGRPQTQDHQQPQRNVPLSPGHVQSRPETIQGPNIALPTSEVDAGYQAWLASQAPAPVEQAYAPSGYTPRPPHESGPRDEEQQGFASGPKL